MFISIRVFCEAFRRDDRGTILIIAALGFLVLVAVGGAGFDLGRQQIVRLKLQQATDAASLAGALLPVGVDNDQRRDEALRYYNLNYPSEYLGVRRPTPTVDVSSTVRVVANTSMNTSFMENVGITKLAVKGASTALVRGLKIDYDLVMVVDESGSTTGRCQGCNGTIMNTERKAITDMLDTIFPEGHVNKNVRFGLIGYTQHISNKWGLTSNKAQAVNAVSFLSSMDSNFDHYGLEAGYNMITGNTDSSVANGRVPFIKHPMLFNCTAVQYNFVLPPNNTCVVKNSGCLFPTEDKPCVLVPVDIAVRNTNVPPPQTARTDGASISPVKNVVFITDGLIMREPAGCTDGPKFKGDTPIAGAPCPNYPAFLKECTKIKDAGATLFTISFVAQGAGDVTTLKSCASVDPATGQPRYFFAPNGQALKAILQNIGVTITKVRIFQ